MLAAQKCQYWKFVADSDAGCCNVFAGVYSEGVQRQPENALAAQYRHCLRQLSVGDAAATLRGRPSRPVNGTVKKDSDAHLLRYGSIQSLPTNVARYSAIVPYSDSGSTLKPRGRTAAETIYATPMETESPSGVEVVDSPPPLPPPPLEFQSVASRSEVIPIATKVHHTYANVAEAVQAKSSAASDVESSFRPGQNARLSTSAVNSNRLATSAAAAAGNVENAVIGSSSEEVQCSSSLSLNSVSYALSSSSLNSSVSSLGYLAASASTPACSAASTLPWLPPPAPPRRAARQANGPKVKEGVSGKPDANGGGLRAGSRREAASVGRRVARTADELQHDYPPHRLLRGTGQTKADTHSMVAPLKVVREHAHVARMTTRSLSVDASAPENVVADGDRSTVSADLDSASSEDTRGGFLLLAERARQEYIKRRASVIGCEDRASETCVAEQLEVTARSIFSD